MTAGTQDVRPSCVTVSSSPCGAPAVQTWRSPDCAQVIVVIVTVNRAVDVLREEGLVVTVPGQGVWVTDRR
jgi:hypothetical protein